MVMERGSFAVLQFCSLNSIRLIFRYAQKSLAENLLQEENKNYIKNLLSEAKHINDWYSNCTTAQLKYHPSIRAQSLLK